MTLWFYWGQPHLTYLRWFTLYSASTIAKDITLVKRRTPVTISVNWKEKQDFQDTPTGNNWWYEMPSGIKIVDLEDIAPEIAELNAPDIQTSDLLSWYLLATYGGTVADMDILFFKPLPEITQDVQVVRFTGHPKPDYIPVSFMQGNPCNFWRATYTQAMAHYDPNVYESCGTDALTYHPQAGLPESIVFPFAGQRWALWHRWLFDSEEWPVIPSECIGLHWYAGHNQKYNRSIQSFQQARGAMGWAMREVLCASQ